MPSSSELGRIHKWIRWMAIVGAAYSVFVVLWFFVAIVRLRWVVLGLGRGAIRTRLVSSKVLAVRAGVQSDSCCRSVLHSQQSGALLARLEAISGRRVRHRFHSCYSSTRSCRVLPRLCPTFTPKGI